jgi:hypothetical protein
MCDPPILVWKGSSGYQQSDSSFLFTLLQITLYWLCGKSEMKIQYLLSTSSEAKTQAIGKSCLIQNRN